MLSVSRQTQARLFACLGVESASKFLIKSERIALELCEKWMLRLQSNIGSDSQRLFIDCLDLGGNRFTMVIPLPGHNYLNEILRLKELDGVGYQAPVSYDEISGAYLLKMEPYLILKSGFDSLRVYEQLRQGYAVPMLRTFHHLGSNIASLFDLAWREAVRDEERESYSDLIVAHDIYEDLFATPREDDVILHGNLLAEYIASDDKGNIIFASPNFLVGSRVFDLAFLLVSSNTPKLDERLKELEPAIGLDQVNRLWQMSWMLCVLYPAFKNTNMETEDAYISRRVFIETYRSRA